MKALVTGGAGFIGSHIAETLLVGGGDVRIIDDLSTGSRRNLETLPAGFEFIEADIRNGEALARAVAGMDVVFHLAAQVSVPASVNDPVATYEINATGTARLLEECVRAGVGRVVFSSSCAVYGDSPVLPKHEEMAVEPLSPYAATKVAGEHLMSMYARLHGIETVSLRYFNVFGPRQDPASQYAAVIPRFIERMGRDQRPVVFGDGRQTRDFIYVANVVDANLAAARRGGASGVVLNVGSGKSIDLIGLVGTLNGVLGTNLAPEFVHPRPGDILHSSSDITRAREVLGWEPRVGLEEGLRLAAAWSGR